MIHTAEQGCIMAEFGSSGEVRLDINREERKGFGEVVFCDGKSDDQLRVIARQLVAAKKNMAFSRLDARQFEVVGSVEGIAGFCKYNETARFGWTEFSPIVKRDGLVAVVSAGSSDVPVAEEAAAVIEFSGLSVKRFYDVGVAGIHRLMSVLPEIREAGAVIVAAGMDGALPSVVTGLVPALVIGLPTSVGYGVAEKGMTAMRSMLCSCSPGLVVVNIDNGIGAGLAAVIAACKKDAG